MGVNVLGVAGLVKISDLLIADPNFFDKVDRVESSASDLDAKGSQLVAEGEAKVKSGNGYKDQAKRQLDAVKRIRGAAGEKKGV